MTTAAPPNPRLQAALAHARRGRPVFPVYWPARGHCGCGDAECSSPAKHPIGELAPHGSKNATTSAPVLRAFWQHSPLANVGMATGIASGVTVLDVDGDKGGYETLARLEGEHSQIAHTQRVVTASGEHIYLKYPVVHLRNTASVLGPGLDVRCCGGYVVTVGAVHWTGVPYQWREGHDPNSAPIADCPTWMLELLIEKPVAPRPVSRPYTRSASSNVRYVERAVESELAELAASANGTRNNRLNVAAFNLGQFVGAGELDRFTVEGALLDGALNVGLTEREAQQTIRSGIEAGIREPRVIPEPTKGPPRRQDAAAPDSVQAADAESAEAFPIEALPLALRAFVNEGALSLVCPPDFLAVPLLVLAGATLGGGMELEVKPGWREGPNLYAAVVGDPGSKKSPALDQAARPVYRVQKKLKHEYDEAYTAFEDEAATWDATPKRERIGARPRPPVFQHVITTDATTEALAAMFQTANGLVLTKDELVGWVKSMDQYRGGRGADRQHFLSFWSRQTVKVDRKGGAPIMVSRPCLSVLGGIQPDLLPELADAARREDGFLDRLLWSYPEAVPDRWTDDGIRLETVVAVEGVFQALYERRGTLDETDSAEPVVITLSAEARELWQEWYAARTGELEQPGFPRRLRGAWAKLPSQLARLALILHALRDMDSQQLSVETLGHACDCLEYFKGHAQRVYGLLRQQQRDVMTKILCALTPGTQLSRRDLHLQVLHGNTTANRITSTLEELEAAGLVRRETRKPDTGRPAEVWLRV